VEQPPNPWHDPSGHEGIRRKVLFFAMYHDFGVFEERLVLNGKTLTQGHARDDMTHANAQKLLSSASPTRRFKLKSKHLPIDTRGQAPGQVK
jgi:hypothetical protein